MGFPIGRVARLNILSLFGFAARQARLLVRAIFHRLSSSV